MMSGWLCLGQDECYFTTLCASGVIIALFVCYVFLKDMHKRQ